MAAAGRVVAASSSIAGVAGALINQTLSLIVFCFLDLLDFILCFFYKLLDFILEGADDSKPCYCSSAITTTSNILLSEHGHSKVLCQLSPTRLHLDDISDTLYSRPSLIRSNHHHVNHTTLAVKSAATTTLQILHKRGGGVGQQPLIGMGPRWSDCDCHVCNSWASSCHDSLFVRAHFGAGSGLSSSPAAKEDVLFIHGFISSSAFWTETLFPNFSSAAKSKYRFFAVDLLGFGRSPKPPESLYTLREHVDMIDKSVLQAYKVKSFHIVAHSLGCILALALAVKHPQAVKSITLLAPPYYPVPEGEESKAAQYVMRRVAPRRIWPPMALCASVGCWYEHVTRTVCLLICKNHRMFESLARFVLGNRMRTFLLEGWFCHTHNAAWHTLHNIICGTAGKMEAYLDAVRDGLKCDVTIYHGEDDELIPLGCSYDVQAKVPRARVKVVENKDHITIVVGRQKAFANELEEIWKGAAASTTSSPDQRQIKTNNKN